MAAACSAHLRYVVDEGCAVYRTFLVVGSIDSDFLLGLCGVLMTVVISAVLALHTGDCDSAH